MRWPATTPLTRLYPAKWPRDAMLESVMAIGTRSYVRRYLGPGGLPPGIRWLLISNVAIFILYFFSNPGMREVLDSFGLRPSDVVTRLFVWQLATYMFLHAGIGHILWNMLALWLFGRELENTWGT